MATSIGSVGCDYLYGRPPSSTGGPFSLRAVKIDTGANIETWIASIEALALALEVWMRPGVDGWGMRTVDSRTGSVVTVTLTDATTYTQCLVAADGVRSPVSVVQKKGVIMSTGTAGYWCEVEVAMFRYP
jgi:hypothetical protein